MWRASHIFVRSSADAVHLKPEPPHSAAMAPTASACECASPESTVMVGYQWGEEGPANRRIWVVSRLLGPFTPGYLKIHPEPNNFSLEPTPQTLIRLLGVPASGSDSPPWLRA